VFRIEIVAYEKDRLRRSLSKLTPSRQTGGLTETGRALENSTRRRVAVQPVLFIDSGVLAAEEFIPQFLSFAPS
jgi:hypothetical protein